MPQETLKVSMRRVVYVYDIACNINEVYTPFRFDKLFKYHR